MDNHKGCPCLLFFVTAVAAISRPAAFGGRLHRPGHGTWIERRGGVGVDRCETFLIVVKQRKQSNERIGTCLGHLVEASPRDVRIDLTPPCTRRRLADERRVEARHLLVCARTRHARAPKKGIKGNNAEQLMVHYHHLNALLFSFPFSVLSCTYSRSIHFRPVKSPHPISLNSSAAGRKSAR